MHQMSKFKENFLKNITIFIEAHYELRPHVTMNRKLYDKLLEAWDIAEELDAEAGYKEGFQKGYSAGLKKAEELIWPEYQNE